MGVQMKRADAAVGDAARAVGDFIAEVGGGEGGPAGVAEPFLVETAFDSAFAVGQLLVAFTRNPFLRVVTVARYNIRRRRNTRDFEFFQILASPEHGAFA
jgi:hypothetical protein